TSKTGRVLSVHPQHALLAAARRAAADPAWQAEYRRWRPPVERAIAWLVAHGNNRRVPYRGITKNNTWLHHRAAALNLRRLAHLRLTRTSDGTWAHAQIPKSPRSRASRQHPSPSLGNHQDFQLASREAPPRTAEFRGSGRAELTGGSSSGGNGASEGDQVGALRAGWGGSGGGDR